MAASSALSWLASRPNFEAARGAGTAAAMAAGKSRLRSLLRELGDPHDTLPAVIHVAGSKGKGSTCEFISSMLRCAGLRTGVYSSPHLVTFGERLRVDQRSAISSEDWRTLVESGHRAALRVNDPSLTHFEVVTALAFRHFINERVDVAVIEAGMGGEDDATNVFSGTTNLAVSVVTHIGMDHAEHLGGTLETIAAHKAGICKQGSPLILAEQDRHNASSIVRAISNVTRARGVRIERSEDIVRTSRRGDGTVSRFAWSSGTFEARLGLDGAHQVRNAATAVHATLRFAESEIGVRALHHASRCGRTATLTLGDDAEFLRMGAEDARLLGRFDCRQHRVRRHDRGAVKIQEKDHVHHHVVLDCAHNYDSAVALRIALDEAYPAASGWSHTLIVAMASDKDVVGFATALAPIVRNGSSGVIVTSVPIAGSTTRCASPDNLAASWRTALGADDSDDSRNDASEANDGYERVTVCATVRDALDVALSTARQRHVVCVTGSTYCVGATYTLLDEE